MTTEQVAKKYYALIQSGQYAQVLNELYSPDIISTEPDNDTDLPLTVQGIEAYKNKEEIFYAHVEQMHGVFMSEPVISTFFFSIMTGMDVTMKGKQRKKKDQIAVFEVRNGKIVKEQFFYDDFA